MKEGQKKKEINEEKLKSNNTLKSWTSLLSKEEKEIKEESKEKNKKMPTPAEVYVENLQVDKEVRNYLKKIANQYKWHKVITRSITIGVFTAFGATIGFAIFVFALSKIFGTIEDLPVIGEWVEDTNINVLIDEQVENQNQEE